MKKLYEFTHTECFCQLLVFAHALYARRMEDRCKKMQRSFRTFGSRCSRHGHGHTHTYADAHVGYLFCILVCYNWNPDFSLLHVIVVGGGGSGSVDDVLAAAYLQRMHKNIHTLSLPHTLTSFSMCVCFTFWMCVIYSKWQQSVHTKRRWRWLAASSARVQPKKEWQNRNGIENGTNRMTKWNGRRKKCRIEIKMKATS